MNTPINKLKKHSGVSSSGIVWGMDGLTEIQDRPDVKTVLRDIKFIQKS
jgi:hypothetical protein